MTVTEFLWACYCTYWRWQEGRKHFPLLDLGGECHLRTSAVGDKSLSQPCHNTPQEMTLLSKVALLFCTVKCDEHVLRTHLTTEYSLCTCTNLRDI